MKSQIYAVPPTPVQEYQEALILLWIIFLFTTITLLGLLTPHSGRCLSGCPGHSDNFHSRPSSGPGHSGRYLSGCSPGNSHSWSSSSPGHSDRCLSIPISLLTEEDCERTGSELEWFSNPSRLGERECPGRPMKVRGGGCGGGLYYAYSIHRGCALPGLENGSSHVLDS